MAWTSRTSYGLRLIGLDGCAVLGRYRLDQHERAAGFDRRPGSQAGILRGYDDGHRSGPMDGVPMDDSKRCHAKISDRSRRCRKAAMRGQRVCRAHGGASPQAMTAARDRLFLLADDAVSVLQRALDDGDIRAAIQAAKLILDRSGCAPVTDVESFYRDQAPAIVGVITSALVRFGIDVTDAMVKSVVRDELRRVAGADVLGGESVEVHRISATTRERIRSELKGEAVEPDVVVM